MAIWLVQIYLTKPGKPIPHIAAKNEPAGLHARFEGDLGARAKANRDR